MSNATQEQVEYLHAPATRIELVGVVTALRETLNCAIAVALADDVDERNAALLDMNRVSERMGELERELLNAGADPEWDHRK